MATERVTRTTGLPAIGAKPSAANEGPPPSGDDPPSTIIPPAFYRDDEPPEPPDDDPHWREFPNFDGMKGTYLIVAGIVFGVFFVTFAHLLIIFML